MKHRDSGKIPLPALAAQFLKALAATHKPNTCDVYRLRVHRFHQWLSDNQVALSELHRRHMVKWLVHLKSVGTQAMDRSIAAIVTRMYLRWLFEVGAIEIPPDQLIRRSDIPRVPNYLPRPLSPEQDQELQRRLAKSSSTFHRGLLLMRKTGVRVGELRDLEYDCLRIDFMDRNFLKVPLGKLDNERLVPLDDSAVKLLRDLQQQGRTPRPWLLESVQGKKTRSMLFQRALRDIATDLDPLHKVTPHRLRHTYATELMNAGMSLWGIMKLLGHRSVRMTLRYAEITQETVGKEYSQALTQVERNYQMKLDTPSMDGFDPARALNDVIRWLEKYPAREHPVHLLIRRLTRSREQVLEILTETPGEG